MEKERIEEESKTMATDVAQLKQESKRLHHELNNPIFDIEKNIKQRMKTSNFTQVFPIGMHSCSSMICSLQRHKISIMALVRKWRGCNQRNDVEGLEH